jgi:hypothetical protein
MGAQHDERGVVGNKRSGLSSSTLDWLESLDRSDRFEGAFDYVLAVLNAPSYTERFWRALEVDELRIPLTSSASIFDSMAALGERCRTAWTASKQSRSGIAWTGSGSQPLGQASWAEGSIVFANDRRIEGVERDVWDFEVSGYRVLRKWFAAREHWNLNVARSLEALSRVIAVYELIELGPELDQALQQLID